MNENRTSRFYAHQLSLGDVFERPDGSGRIYGPVLKGQVNGVVVLPTGDMDVRPWATVTLIKRGPRCPLGSLVELCNHDCEWPDEAEALHARYMDLLRTGAAR